MTDITVNFADGTHIVVDEFDAEDIVGALNIGNDIIPIGKVEKPDAHFALTPCCFTDKTVVTTVVIDDEDGFFEAAYTVCRDCYKKIDYPNLFEGFLYGLEFNTRV